MESHESNSLDQRMTSSARRLTSTPIIAVTKANSATKSRAAVPSMELALDPLEAQAHRHGGRVEAEALPRQRPGAVRRVGRYPCVPVTQPLRPAATAMRGPAGGARAAPAARAPMRAPRHDHVEVPVGLLGQGVREVEDLVSDHGRGRAGRP